MNFNKRYWIFIAAAMISATVASICTFWLMTVGHSRECNPVAAACFASIGMIPTMIFGILSLLPLMVAVPYLFRQNEKPGFASMFVLGIIVAYTAFDAMNDISAIMGYQHIYLLAHTVLDTTNNVTGSIVGTGESAC